MTGSVLNGAAALNVPLAVPNLSLAVDSGVSNTDKVTKSGTVLVSGLLAGATWFYSTNGGKSWKTGMGTGLVLKGKGAKNVLVHQVDSLGNTSPDASLNFTLDTELPAAPRLALLTDSGKHGNDHITNVAVITGNGDVGNSVVLNSVVAGQSVVLGTAIVDATGHWTISPKINGVNLADGKYKLTVTVTDAAGNASTSEVFDVTLDTVATGLAANLKSDSGSNVGDHTTNVGRLTGTAEAGATITIKEGMTILGTVKANKKGKWNFNPSDLSQGVHAFTITQTDKAGNAATTTLSETFDSVSPGVAISTLTGNVAINNVQIISGTGEAGSKVQLFDGKAALGPVVTVDATGHWTETITFDATQQRHRVTAQGTDLAGNVNTSAAVVFKTYHTIQDNSAPSIKGTGGNDNIFISSANASVKGGSGDDLFTFNVGATGDQHNIHGGKGKDTVDFTALTTAINADLPHDKVSGSQIGTVTVKKIENVIGGSGSDTIVGNNQANVITGGGGNDLLTGGTGDDTFVFTSAGFGSDLITDFAAGPTFGDVMLFKTTQISDWTNLLSKSKQVGSDTVITVNATDSVTLKNLSLSALNQNDVKFV